MDFNSLNVMFLGCVKMYPSKENQTSRKIMKKQIRSNKKCPLYKSYRKFVKINYKNKMKETAKLVRYSRRHIFVRKCILY